MVMWLQFTVLVLFSFSSTYLVWDWRKTLQRWIAQRISVWRRHDHPQVIKHSLPLIKQTSIIKPCRRKWNPPPPKKKTVDQCLCRSAAVQTNEINSDGMSSGSNNPPKLLSNMDCLANPVFVAPVSVSEVTSTLKLMSVQSRRRLLLCRVQV